MPPLHHPQTHRKISNHLEKRAKGFFLLRYQWFLHNFHWALTLIYGASKKIMAADKDKSHKLVVFKCHQVSPTELLSSHPNDLVDCPVLRLFSIRGVTPANMPVAFGDNERLWIWACTPLITSDFHGCNTLDVSALCSHLMAILVSNVCKIVSVLYSVCFLNSFGLMLICDHFIYCLWQSQICCKYIVEYQMVLHVLKWHKQESY